VDERSLRSSGRALITDDGEAIEGEAAEEVEVMGRVTFFINSTDADHIPTIDALGFINPQDYACKTIF
jgi:hypothetical protein